MIYSRIAGTGGYLPDRVITNTDLEAVFDTSDEWIRLRTGVQERHRAGPDESASDLALIAGQRAIAAAGIDPDDIDLIVVATSTSDALFPSCACHLQAKLGITGCGALDVTAACSGFIYALAVADSFIRSDAAGNVLVVGTDVLSRFLNPADRATGVIFGDGAGALVLSRNKEPGVLSTHLHADGKDGDTLGVVSSIRDGRVHGFPYLTMDGNAVFKQAVKRMEEVSREALAHNSLKVGDIDWLIPHQANKRIIFSVCDRLDFDPAKAVITLDKHGNTTAASIPLALDQAIRDGRIRRGNMLLMCAFGSGFTWSSAVLRY
ncbi:beta-ketoacyl-ACP synthase III [Paraburkholderia youngii]|uniref:beta-ketoacyl-ACP synthase III n=1 Tax=Paraburkholderia youngii TaxID=2782701 RepID=UPI003D1E9FCD